MIFVGTLVFDDQTGGKIKIGNMSLTMFRAVLDTVEADLKQKVAAVSQAGIEGVDDIQTGQAHKEG